MPRKPLKRVQGERFPPDDPREWLNRARSNLAQAQARIKGVYLEDLCFNAQQAAEKAIKGVLILNQVEFPRCRRGGRALGRGNNRAGLRIAGTPREPIGGRQ